MEIQDSIFWLLFASIEIFLTAFLIKTKYPEIGHHLWTNSYCSPFPVPRSLKPETSYLTIKITAIPNLRFATGIGNYSPLVLITGISVRGTVKVTVEPSPSPML
jgi:hypothetical protein